jgi:hypothetical protein
MAMTDIGLLNINAKPLKVKKNLGMKGKFMR